MDHVRSVWLVLPGRDRELAHAEVSSFLGVSLMSQGRMEHDIGRQITSSVLVCCEEGAEPRGKVLDLLVDLCCCS